MTQKLLFKYTKKNFPSIIISMLTADFFLSIPLNVFVVVGVIRGTRYGEYYYWHRTERQQQQIEKESHFFHRYTQQYFFCLLSTFSLSHAAADAAVVEDENTLEFYFISSRSQLSLPFFLLLMYVYSNDFIL